MERDIRAAGAAVAAAAGERGWSQGQLAQRAGVDSGTLGDFMAGRRWPRNTTQFKIEQALGWRTGSIARIADGGDAPVVTPAPQDARSDLPVGSGVDPELLTELADADPAAIEAVRAVLRAARRGD
jgi:transcriptional regulator with XRE-family HTH domain